jgi:hypothetical protein
MEPGRTPRRRRAIRTRGMHPNRIRYDHEPRRRRARTRGRTRGRPRHRSSGSGVYYRSLGHRMAMRTRARPTHTVPVDTASHAAVLHNSRSCGRERAGLRNRRAVPVRGPGARGCRSVSLGRADKRSLGASICRHGADRRIGTSPFLVTPQVVPALLVLISARAPLVDRDDRDRRLSSSVPGGVSQAEGPSRLHW